MPFLHSRRNFLTNLAATGTLSCFASHLTHAANANDAISSSISSMCLPPFRYSLNFGTLIGFNLPIEEEVDVAAKAGYDAIEPWSRKIDDYIKRGGKLSDLRKRIADHGLAVAGCCSFSSWIVDDDAKRADGLESMKREMGQLREIGGTAIAATAAGATDKRLDQFSTLGKRYATILEMGASAEIVPQLEIWGSSATMSNLADVMAIAIHSERQDAQFLLDVFHLYRGGSSFDSLALFSGRSLTCFHLNDYPAANPENLKDKDRVYPGDGVAPLKDIFSILRQINFSGFLSFEVFNPDYWKTNDPLLVAKTGLDKMRQITEGTVKK
ncbi:MAG: sugar phosphate isomerase/epimerase family protein [Thermoguttaceae bacterium]